MRVGCAWGVALCVVLSAARSLAQFTGDVAGAVVTDNSMAKFEPKDENGVAVEDTSNCFPVGECERCARKKAQSWTGTEAACRMTGFKQANLCKVMVETKACPEEGCESESDREVKSTEARVFLGCTPKGAGPDKVMWFESVMVLGAAGSLYVVWQRKKQAYQRLSTIVNN